MKVMTISFKSVLSFLILHQKANTVKSAYEIIDGKQGGKVISARLKTSEKKNVHFWKSGPAA